MTKHANKRRSLTRRILALGARLGLPAELCRSGVKDRTVADLARGVRVLEKHLARVEPDIDVAALRVCCVWQCNALVPGLACRAHFAPVTDELRERMQPGMSERGAAIREAVRCMRQAARQVRTAAAIDN